MLSPLSAFFGITVRTPCSCPRAPFPHDLNGRLIHPADRVQSLSQNGAGPGHPRARTPRSVPYPVASLELKTVRELTKLKQRHPPPDKAARHRYPVDLSSPAQQPRLP